MKSLILAAGYATRLYPLIENFPKPLLPVGDKPILNLLLDDIDTIPDITEHIIITNHKFIDNFREWEKNLSLSKPITIIDDGSVDNEHRVGAVKDIELTAEKLNITDDLLILAGDNMLTFSLLGFVEFNKEKGASCVMCHEENDLKKQLCTGIITKDKDNLITLFEEKPEKAKGNLAVPPFYCYNIEDIKRIPQAIEDSCGIDAPRSFAAWLSKNSKVYAWIMPGRWYDIGNLETYNRIKENLGFVNG